MIANILISNVDRVLYYLLSNFKQTLKVLIKGINTVIQILYQI